jgi:hypothetical protein
MNELLHLILNYGDAAFEHGRAQAAYETARDRDRHADKESVKAAGRKVLRAYTALDLALRADADGGGHGVTSLR